MYHLKTKVLITLSMVILLTSSVFAVEVLKSSALNGGVQVWWEGEDFDDIAADGTMKQSADSTVQPPVADAFGDDYIAHEGPDVPLDLNSIFVEYQVGSAVSTGGDWYMWMRESHDRRVDPEPGDGRLQNSCWIQVNGMPDNPDAFDAALHRIGQSTGFPAFPDLWRWIGTSETGADVEQGAVNGLLITLNGDGNDVIRIYSREGRPEVTTWVHDVLMISTVDFVPTDDDYIAAEGPTTTAVQPASLSTTWGKIKDAR